MEVAVLAAKETTFVMIKPDCVRDGHTTEIISMIENRGYKILDKKETLQSPLIQRLRLSQNEAALPKKYKTNTLY